MDLDQHKPDCPCCDVLNGQMKPPGGVVYENDFWLVTHSLDADLQPGRLMIFLKRHCDHFARLTQEEASTLGQVIANTAFALLQVFKPSSTYVIYFGEQIKHLHFYIMPRTSEMPAFSYSHLVAYLQKLGLKKTYTGEEIVFFADQLRARLYIEDEI